MDTRAPATDVPAHLGRAAPGVAAPAPSPTRRRVLLRCVVAAIGVMLCSTAPVLPALIPGYVELVTEAEARGAGAVLLAVEVPRMAIAPVLALLLLLALARVEKVRMRDYFGRPAARVAVGALGAAALAAATATALASALTNLSGMERAGSPVLGSVSLPVLVIVGYGLAQAFVLQAVHEEWWFRGYAFRDHRSRPWFVLGATTIGFTLLHLVSSGGQQSAQEHLLYLALPLGMGLWAGVERWCTGTVWAAAGIHGGIHVGLLVSGLAGWSFGPASWVVTGAALSLAAAVRLLVSRPWRSGSGH